MQRRITGTENAAGLKSVPLAYEQEMLPPVIRGLGVLADIVTEWGEPLVGARIESAKLEHAVDYLGEMQSREANIDVLLLF